MMVANIDIKELKGLMDRGEKFTLVNVLGGDSFEQERICGSINIPVSEGCREIEKDAPGLIGREERVIVYCGGPMCTASEHAAERFSSIGYKNVQRFEGGLKEWKEAGYCLEGKLHETRKVA